jgi:hypothetical protein
MLIIDIARTLLQAKYINNFDNFNFSTENT